MNLYKQSLMLHIVLPQDIFISERDGFFYNRWTCEWETKTSNMKNHMIIFESPFKNQKSTDVYNDGIPDFVIDSCAIYSLIC